MPELSVSAGVDVSLEWTAVDDAIGYWVYRNGVKIGETEELYFVDRYSNGTADYYVRAVFAGDHYADSETVQAEVSLLYPMITALDGVWVPLRYSTDSLSSAQTTTQQEVAVTVYSDTVYPVAEISPHRRRSYQINTAFRRGEGAAFEALLGREVFLKDPYGAGVHGVISAISKAENRFYTVFSAALEEVDGDL